jgi:hypothetical protein
LGSIPAWSQDTAMEQKMNTDRIGGRKLILTAMFFGTMGSIPIISPCDDAQWRAPGLFNRAEKSI